MNTEIKMLKAVWSMVEAEIDLAIEFKDSSQHCIHLNRHLRDRQILKFKIFVLSPVTRWILSVLVEEYHCLNERRAIS